MSTVSLAVPAHATSAKGGEMYHRFEQWQGVAASSFANLHLYAFWVEGSVTASAIAIGNNFSGSYDTNGGRVGMSGVQRVGVGLFQGAEVDAKVSDVHGNVDLSAIAICNNSNTKVTGAHEFGVESYQLCTPIDPFAGINGTLNNVGGNVSLAAVAIANNFSIDAEATNFNASYLNAQVNTAPANAVINASMANVGGDVSASAVAIGNNMSVTVRRP